MKADKKMLQQAEDVFERWRASLIERDRSHGSLSENFNDLFYDLHRIHLPYEEAKDFMVRAYKAHLPNSSVINHTFKSMKKAGKYDDKEDFRKSWFGMIKDKATNAFHEYFELPFEDGKSESQTKREKALKKKSAMISEYIENYEQIDLGALRQEMEEAKNEIVEDLDTDNLLEELGIN